MCRAAIRYRNVAERVGYTDVYSYGIRTILLPYSYEYDEVYEYPYSSVPYSYEC